MLSIILVAAFVCHIASAIVVPERKDINSFMVGPPDPGYDRDISDIVRDENYTFESHEVITEDGYILELHRIVVEGGKPVLCLHKMDGSSNDFVINRPELAPAFILASSGFDVWMGNNRGNFHSQHHISFPYKSETYWNFTSEDMGTKDLPAMIDFVIK